MKVMKTKCLRIETDGEQALKEGHWSFEAAGAKIILRGLPEWGSGLRQCIAVLEASLQTRV